MRITTGFVEDRFKALQARWSERNARMDEYEKLYLLDMWEDSPEPDERRISAPVCWNTVETFRTLLLTRPPVISVPPSEVKEVEEADADRIEKYLYGVWYQARVVDALNLAEWNGCCLGEGVLRCVYDGKAVEGDLPLVIDALNPRSVYATPGRRPGQDVEVVHGFKRRRREIEEEWGVKLGTKGTRPSEAKRLAAWLDEKVDFIDYWRVDVEVSDREEEEGAHVGAPQQGAPLRGALRRVVELVRGGMGNRGAEGAGAEPVAPLPEGPPTGLEEFPTTGDLLGVGPEDRALESPPTEERGPVRRRVVRNCVVVEGEFVKKPVVMVGYRRLPFVRYAGIPTPLADENGALSVLFAITGGVREEGTQGLAAAFNELLAMKQRIIEMFANGALVTDDDKLEIDWTPGAINPIGQGKKWNWLVPPGPHPAVDGQVGLVERLIQDATVSASMMGRYVGDVSGIALSALNNPVLMRIAHRQQVRERAYEALNVLILELTEEFAPAEGWYVYGLDQKGAAFELQLGRESFSGYTRNRVELSASLPKDQAGEIMGLADLVGRKLISRQTFLDQLQRTKQLSSQSPQDEMKRILRDVLLFEGPTAEKLAKLVLSEYSEELAALLEETPPPAPPPQAGEGGPPGGPPGGPMMGMPPSVVPPQGMPEAVGREDLAAMMAMQGEGPPGRPPGGGG